MAGRLKNRVALVTGAAQGIGAGIAAGLAREGAIVISSDINVKALGGEGERAKRLDVSSEADWAEVAASIDSSFGRLDVLINNAGIEVVTPAAEMSLDAWRRVMSVNLDGVFLGCRTMMPLLAKAGESGDLASIVNISSVAGIVAYPNQVAYNTSKAGVRHLSKSLAVEWAQAGVPIRVNSVHPGIIRTPMLEELLKTWKRDGILSVDDPWAFVAGLCPMKTIGTPEDIAAGAIYLASTESRFVTGTELVIDGGWIAV